MVEKKVKSVEVTRTYLEMSRPDDLNLSGMKDLPVRTEVVSNCPASFYRYLYEEVGRNYYWISRLDWTSDRIREHLARPNVLLGVIYYGGVPAGFFELQRHEDNSIEILYLGLLSEFIGCGIGKHLIVQAVKCAFDNNANCVWLHTCTLDSPAALPNYLQRGFRPFKKETYIAHIPDK